MDHFQCQIVAHLIGVTVAIETDTGDVELRLAGKNDDYETFVTTRTGDSNIASHKGSPRMLTVKTATGDIEIYFKDK